MGKLQKLDNRIQIMLQNGIKSKHRTIFLMVGNKGQDQVPIMYQVLNSLFNKGKLKVLWCYKKELSFSTHRKKNLRLLNKKRKAGFNSESTVFEQFICSSDIRWCYYHETHKILGQTFDMCILQDFEALTPNTLARTIETVSGGGLIVFLLKSMDSLRQLCAMVMDVHSRYRTEAHQDVVCRFNERFLLSLSNNTRCLALDDRWTILPLSKKVLSNLAPVTVVDQMASEQSELNKLKVSLSQDGSPFAPLVKLCVTFDQAKSLVQFCAAIASTSLLHSTKVSQTKVSIGMANSLLNSIGSSDKNVGTSSAVVTVTSGRGRGKSAALGLGIAAAIETGMPNLYVTAPSPENLGTLMQFVMRGLVALQYEEHQDYTVLNSTDPDHNQCIVRIDVHRQGHRQSLIYLPPWEFAGQSGTNIRQADLVCIDEAAAIPLPLVQSIIYGPRLVFMASTVNGYEGTGRSLSLKLIRKLRNECILSDTTKKLETKAPSVNLNASGKNEVIQLGKSLQHANTSRVLYEVTLNEAIRYANGDPVEAWLTDLLCLDCGELLTKGIDSSATYYPPVDQCQLYYVNRDTLFAYHKSTEVFLHRLMALYVSSHYKNSPNDLQLLSDAPAHHIFCLLAPYDPESGRVPEILCVLQVCLEGQVNKQSILRSLSRGLRPSGDLIPWTISQQFCDADFGQLSGARVVRIATHSDYQGLGYGSRALKLLFEYYSGMTTGSNEVQTSIEDSAPSSAQSKCKKSHNQETKLKSHEINKKKSTHSKRTIPNKLDILSSDEEEIDDSMVEGFFAVDNDGDNDNDSDADQDDADEQLNDDTNGEETSHGSSKLLTETIERRGPSTLPPLLNRLDERPHEPLDYIGVSFGATPNLLRFWKRAGYVPVYLRQSLNELTGEFTCIMIKPVKEMSNDRNWILEYFEDFRNRLMRLLPGPFKYIDAAYGLELLTHKIISRYQCYKELTPTELFSYINNVDLERLRRYSRSLVDFHMVSDLISQLAQFYFRGRLPNVRLNRTQQVILLGLGLQLKSVERLASEFDRLFDDKTSASNSGRDGTAVSTILAHFDENKHNSPSALFESAAVGEKHKLTPDTGVTTNWVKRIRGLLFVIVRELVANLDSISGGVSNTNLTQSTNFDKSQTHRLTKQTSLTMEDYENEESEHYDEVDDANDDDDDDNDDNDIEMLEDEEQSEKSDAHDDEGVAKLSDSEIERRAAVVRQLMSEELMVGGGPTGSLGSYRIHGSESDWAQAVVGHGSDLSSLTVKVAQKSKTISEKKMTKKNKWSGNDTGSFKKSKAKDFQGKSGKRRKVH